LNISIPSKESFAISVHKDSLYLDLTSNLFLFFLSLKIKIRTLALEAKDAGERFWFIHKTCYSKIKMFA